MNGGGIPTHGTDSDTTTRYTGKQRTILKQRGDGRLSG